jgi:hypothetical protein
MSGQVFRFEDLPIELRFMVYERIPVIIRHHTFEPPVHADRETGLPVDQETSSAITLVTKTISTSILATSRAINLEAIRIFRPRLDALLKEPTRFIVHEESADAFVGGLGILSHMRTKIEGLLSGTSAEAQDATGTIDLFRFRGMEFAVGDARQVAVANFLDKIHEHMCAPLPVSGLLRPLVISFAISEGTIRGDKHVMLACGVLWEILFQLSDILHHKEVSCGMTLTPLAEWREFKDIAANVHEAYWWIQNSGRVFQKAGAKREAPKLVGRVEWEKEWAEG